jgi:hypothetical protein
MRSLCDKHGVAYGHYGRSGRSEAYAEVAAEQLAGEEQLAFDLNGP